jgi:hypothetical protein
MKKLLTCVASLLPYIVIALFIWNLGLALTAPLSHAQQPADPAGSKNMSLVGVNDLQSRSTYQPVVHRQGNQWILYAGHHTLGTNPVTGAPLPSFNPLTGRNEENGTSIVDVTDPQNPVYLAHLPVANGAGGGAQMVRVCDGSSLPIHNAKVYMLRSYANSAHEIWDVTDPKNPQPVRTVSTNNPVIGAQTGQPGALAGTHKNWWECDTGIAYIVGRRGDDTAAGWRPGNHILIFDLSDPANPVFIRDWALDGQQPGGEIPANFTAVPSIHGPISTGPAGNRVYFAYGTGENGVMQIVDRNTLLTSDPNDFKTAEIGRWVMNPINGAHTSFPIGKIAIADWAPNAEGNVRDFVVVVSEETDNECTGPRHLVYFVDVTDESRPQSQANFQVPASSSPFNFCERGGRFGPHATNENFGLPFYQKIVFVSYFNAGVRAIDVRDPFTPQEVAFYIPATTADTDYRCATINGIQDCKIAIQTNNVDTDERGYIYIVDRANTGLHILQLTGSAREIIEE